MAENKATVFENSIKGFLGPVWALLQDEKITEVMINGHEEIWVEIRGKIQKTDAKFKDEDALRSAVNNIAQSVGRRINDEEPRLDARLPNGFRVHAVIPPCSRKGTTVAIRKFSTTQFTFKDYITIGAMTADAAQFLDIAMKLGKNVLVSGGTGSGKTTLLSVLSNRIPKGQRVIVIEDSSELKVEYEHVVFFETQMADEAGNGEVTIRDLLKSSLRLRPDRIIVGEVRGAEALELIQAMNTGHKGCMGHHPRQLGGGRSGASRGFGSRRRRSAERARFAPSNWCRYRYRCADLTLRRRLAAFSQYFGSLGFRCHRRLRRNADLCDSSTGEATRR